MSIALHLPDENELEAESQSHVAEAAELELADDAAAAVEEGDEEEAVEGGKTGSLDDLHDPEFVEVEDAEDTLLEEPADEAAGEEQEQPPATEAAAVKEPDGTPPTPAAHSPARLLTPHQPPKSAALVAYEHRRAEARDRYEGTMFEFRKLEAAAKAAKERWKDAEDQLFEVLNEGGDFEEEAEQLPQLDMTPEVLAVVDGPGKIHGPALKTEPVKVVDISSPAPADPNAWRRVPVSELHLENIKGLGAKKIEQITLACPTIGHLEDLRAGFDGLKALDGIGQAKADAIEDAILNWLSKNRDKEVLAAAAAAREEAADVAEETASEESAASDQSSAPTEAVEEGVAESTSADAERDAIIARAQAIYFRTGDFSGVSDEDVLNQASDDSRFWESGSEARDRGDELIHCPWQPGVEQDDWLRGWMTAEIMANEGWQGPGSEG